MLRPVLERADALDRRSVAYLNRLLRRQQGSVRVAATAACGLAGVEIALMVWLGLRGHVGTALRMLLATGILYVGVELLGRCVKRERPFVAVTDVQRLVEHDEGRSFPSRHVASAFAMAALARPADRTTGYVMTLAALGLGLSRVATGLHYPTDVLAGAALGQVVGWALSGHARR